MSSGLQRRRVAGGTASATSERTDSPSHESSNNNTARNGFNEDGRRVAYDPDDINRTVDELKQPKLTLMEEVLLLGIKDKQVGKTKPQKIQANNARGTCHFGTTTFHTL